MPSADIITLGCEAGGPEAAAVCSAKVPLYRALKRHVSSSHCSAVAQYCLVLRVDGVLVKYGEEGVHRVRMQRSRRYMTADIQIPENAWKPLTHLQLRLYLARQVHGAVEACVARLVKDRQAIARSSLLAEVEAGCKEYVSATTDG